MKSQEAIRTAFWAAHPTLQRRRHRYAWSASDKTAELVHHVDARTAFCDYVDMLASDGVITEALAQRVTL
jgi:hypothetical protein